MLAHDANGAWCAPLAIATTANDSLRPLRSESGFPEDTVAHIFRPARSAMTSGRARTKQWRLVFARRRPLLIEPVMGWIGDDDPLAQVEISFPNCETAIAYAQRLGVAFIVHHDE